MYSYNILHSKKHVLIALNYSSEDLEGKKEQQTRSERNGTVLYYSKSKKNL